MPIVGSVQRFSHTCVCVCVCASSHRDQISSPDTIAEFTALLQSLNSTWPAWPQQGENILLNWFRGL